MKNRFLTSTLLALLASGSFAENSLLLDDIGITLDPLLLELEPLDLEEIPSQQAPTPTVEPEPEIVPESFFAPDPTFEPEFIVEPEPVIEPVPVAEPAPAPQPATPTQVNIVNVSEVFYRLEYSANTNSYTRSPINEAVPGDLVELVIRATNDSDQVVTNTKLTNTIPSGPIQLLTESFRTDLSKSLYRYSKNGQDFFPSDSGINADAIRYVQWIIFSLAPGESLELSYRIQIKQ